VAGEIYLDAKKVII